MNKKNPRRIPATKADMNRAKNNATIDAMKRMCYLFLYILIDKHNASYEDVSELAKEINYYAESVNEKRITWKDIEHVVREEYDVCLPW